MPFDEKQSYVYALLDPRLLPAVPFYIGIGHDRNLLAEHVYERYSRPFNGHFLMKSIQFIKKHNKNNSSKLNRITSIKENCLDVQVYILEEDLTSKEAKALEIKYIKRFGRKGIDKNGVLTNVMPGGDGHDRKSSKFCREAHPDSSNWATDWRKDEEKVQLWRRHLSESSREDEAKTHWRAKNAKNVGKTIWQDKDFRQRKSKSVSEINKRNWNDPNYRKKMCSKLRKFANTDERRKISANNLRSTVNKLWSNSKEFRDKVSERTKRKALMNNSDKTVIKRQQAFRLVSMYINKYKKYPWADCDFDIKRSPALLEKLYYLYINDKDWLEKRLNSLKESVDSLLKFLYSKGFMR